MGLVQLGVWEGRLVSGTLLQRERTPNNKNRTVRRTYPIRMFAPSYVTKNNKK